MGDIIERGGGSFPEDWENSLDPMANRALVLVLEDFLAQKMGNAPAEIRAVIEQKLRNPNQKTSDLVAFAKKQGITDFSKVAEKAKELYSSWHRK